MITPSVAAYFPTLLEIITGCFALAVQAFYLRRRNIATRSSVVIALLTVPALVMSLESMNSILTCDESYIIYEPVDLANDSLLMWNLGAFRTTDLLIGIPLAGLKKVTGFSMDILAVIAKSMHWLLSFCMIMVIIDLLLSLVGKKDDVASQYVFLLYAILLLPVVLLAQKIINYDAFSLLCGSAALLLLITGWDRNKSHYLPISVIVALLAAQEKLIASPLLWICLCAASLRLSILHGTTHEHIPLKKTAAISLRMIAMVMFVMITGHLIVSLINAVNQPAATAFNLFNPLINGFWPILNAAGINTAALYARPSFQSLWNIPVLALIIASVFAGVTTAIALCINAMQRHARTFRPVTAALDRLPIVNHLIFFLLFFFSIATTYCIHAYLAPYYPVAPGMYEGHLFNKSFIYFGASSKALHLAFSTGWAYATFANTIPSVFVLIAAINAVFITRKKLRSLPGADIAFFTAMCAPLLYGILQVPIGSRYFNIFILFIVIRLSIDFLRISLPVKIHKIRTAVFILLLIAELFPFRPLYGAFRPVWSNYSSTYNETPSKAVLNPWWMGWGEEVFLAGKCIRRRLKETNPSLTGVTLYHNYPGEWLFNKNGATVVRLDTAATVSYTENDFFILNRMGIAESDDAFPCTTTPFCTIGYRGFTSAWVFRGSDLEKAGYGSPKP